VSNAETTVLYILSTLAQTCAALAAFVGAVGLFRLQVLRERHAGLERDMRGWGEWLTGQECHRLPLADVLTRIEKAEKSPSPDRAQYVKPLQDARRRWEAFPARLTASRLALVVFVAWNLLVIGVSLVGFNYVPALASPRMTFWGLGVTAAGTVAVTVYCIVAWTKD
jgi:hypothetical protein